MQQWKLQIGVTGWNYRGWSYKGRRGSREETVRNKNGGRPTRPIETRKSSTSMESLELVQLYPWRSFLSSESFQSRVPYTKLACTLIALRLEPSFELASHEFIIFFRVSLRFLIVWYSKEIIFCMYFYCSCTISETFVFNWLIHVYI